MPQERIFFDTYDVVASPGDDTETVIAILEGVVQRYNNTTIALSGWVSLAPDADATGMVLAIRRGDIDGDIINDAFGIIAAAGTFSDVPVSIEVQDDQLGQVIDATYVLTLTCADASDTTSVNAVKLEARVH